MAKKPPQAGGKIHISNLQPETVYVAQSPFGEAEVSIISDNGESVTLEIHAGYLQAPGSQRKGRGETFMGPRNAFVFWEKVVAG